MNLTARQIRIVGECLNAAAFGPFIPDSEFATVFGLECGQVAEVARQWPVVISAHKFRDCAIHNSFNNMLKYPSKHKDKWDDYLSVTREELEQIFADWREQV